MALEIMKKVVVEQNPNPCKKPLVPMELRSDAEQKAFIVKKPQNKC